MDESKLSLIKYRLERASEELMSAKQLLDKRLFRAALSSSYYCIFHTIRVLFALENIESKTHKGIAFLFDQKFIKTGLLPVELYKFFIEAY